jgi:hypothetical protein
MRPLLLGMALAGFCAAQVDPREVLIKSLAADDANWRVARNYTFIERSDQRRLDSAGHLKSREIKTADVTLLEGTPYRRLIARNDQPLSAAEEKDEAERLAKSIDERRRETPEQRTRRLAEYETKRERMTESMRQIPEAFNLRLLGEEQRSGRTVYVIEANPKPGYRSDDRIARFYPKLKGKIWVDKQDYQWVRTEAEVIDSVSFGWVLARLAKGGRMSFEQTRVNGEVWLPHVAEISGSARVALFKVFNIQQEITFRDYRKFTSESRIVSASEVVSE